MPIETYRYGEPRHDSSLRVGTTRHPPRGVKRVDYARRDLCDVWLPLLGPSGALLQAYRREELTFAQFAMRYRREMKEPAARQVIDLLAAAARTQPISVGCYCADEARCHRTLLGQLLREAADQLPAAPPEPATSGPGYYSPACAMPEIED